MLFMMRQCNTISNLKEDLQFQKEVSATNFNNYLAAKDSIEYFENELGDKVAKISSFEFQLSDLEKTNIDINNKYVRVLGLNRDLIGVNSLLSAEIKVKDSVGELIYFKRLNLLENWPMSGPFDIIFCRNVVIYFDKETQKKLFEKYANMLVPGGYLFIGHSENLHGISDRFQNLGQTIYRKIR